ncbi:MAG: DUF262 domain-containing protein [Clostridium sp.]|nr:DUF262 domain-containing protein [Clostridium sp.]
MANYEVSNKTVNTMLSWIDSGEIAIPEIQRPFVWKASKVRDLIDSLYRDFPIGYLIIWQNPNVRLKGGDISVGKKVIIDGQQRLTALSAALRGNEIFDENYNRKRIIISFNPVENKFDVANPAIKKSSTWIYDISKLFKNDFSSFDFVQEYHQKNPNSNPSEISRVINKITGIRNNLIGIIELSHQMEVEDVTDIFIRINSTGVELSQADFAMSKISSNKDYGGNDTRKLIDYFCHLMNNPADYDNIRKNDEEFSRSELFKRISWVKSYNEDIYILNYSDVLRVAFTYKFKRGRLSELVNLLSGRDFEARQYEEEIAEDTFKILREGVLEVINENKYKRYMMILKSVGIIDKTFVRSQNVINFGYILYLTLRETGMNQADIEKIVGRWIVMSMLTGRYSSSPESAFDYDIKRIKDKNAMEVLKNIEDGELSDAFWNVMLVTNLEASIRTNPQYNVYLMSKVKNGTKGFLSKNITIRNMIENRGDTHHIFPKKYLQKNGFNNRGLYNQLANYVYTQTEINIAIKDKSPKNYFSAVIEQCHKENELKYGGINDIEELYKNLRENDIPVEVVDLEADRYEEFLGKRRRLMAMSIKRYYKSLGK